MSNNNPPQPPSNLRPQPQPRRTGIFTTSLTTDTPSPSLSRNPSPIHSPTSSNPTSSTSTDHPLHRSHSPSLRPPLDGGLGSKTRSVLNLTSSALYGIYSPMSAGERENYDPQSLEASQSQRSGLTPYGNGAQTPIRSVSGERGGNGSGSGVPGSISRSSSSFFMTATTSDLAREADRKRRRLEGHGHIAESETSGAEAGGKKGKGVGRPRSMSHDHRMRSWTRDAGWFVLRTIALGLIGVAYGVFVEQLQDKKVVAPVKVEGIDTDSRWYLLFWGVSAIVLGNTLPYVDRKMGNGHSEEGEQAGGRREGEEKEDFLLRQSETSNVKREQNTRGSLGADWNPAVRSIGAFVGIAFAIRRLPWQSTLQLSLTLALANPCIWYLIDRTRPGFLLSSFVGIVGAAVLLTVHPAVLPQPTSRRPYAADAFSVNASRGENVGRSGDAEVMLPLGLSRLGLTYESIGVATWAASVLFCSAVCFGNIGRRLGRGLR